MASKVKHEWTDEEIDVLIDEYEAHPCLWDIDCRKYHLGGVIGVLNPGIPHICTTNSGSRTNI